MKLKLDPETVDAILVAALKRHLKILKKPLFVSKNPDDLEATAKVIAAHKELIDYYGG